MLGVEATRERYVLYFHLNNNCCEFCSSFYYCFSIKTIAIIGTFIPILSKTSHATN